MTNSADNEIHIVASGDTALVVSFGDVIDPHINALVTACAERLEAAELDGVVELVPTFRSLMVHYDPDQTSHAQLEASIEGLLADLSPKERSGRLWHLPACYDASVAPDIEEVCARTGLGEKDLVGLHTSITFRVYMIGFLPGFPYMGDLPDRLVLPRREDPRTTVPRGSVAIAERMTAIYPLESPGGWHLIGRTPVILYSPSRAEPSLLAAGDLVRFVAIPVEEFERLKSEADHGRLNIEPQRDRSTVGE